MIWVAIAVGGFAAWLSVVVFFVALCSAASRTDGRAAERSVPATPNVINLAALRPFRERRDGKTAIRASLG
jgi:hypothetical protein